MYMYREMTPAIRQLVDTYLKDAAGPDVTIDEQVTTAVALTADDMGLYGTPASPGMGAAIDEAIGRLAADVWDDIAAGRLPLGDGDVSGEEDAADLPEGIVVGATRGYDYVDPAYNT